MSTEKEDIYTRHNHTPENDVSDGATKKHCLDCGAPLYGPYCHICGQPASVERLSMKHFVFHSIAEVYHANSKYIPTAYRLLTQPWSMISDYINCKRSKLLDPISFLLFSILLKVVIRMLIGDQTYEAALAHVDAISEAENPAIAIWYYFRDSSLLIWLLIGIPCAWLLPLFFRKNSRKKYNFAEYTAAGMYMTGALYIFSAILLPFTQILHGWIYLFLIVYGIMMGAIGISHAYRFTSRKQQYLKTILYFIAVPVIYLSAILVIVLLYYAIFEPENFMSVLLD